MNTFNDLLSMELPSKKKEKKKLARCCVELVNEVYIRQNRGVLFSLLVKTAFISFFVKDVFQTRTSPHESIFRQEMTNSSVASPAMQPKSCGIYDSHSNIIMHQHASTCNGNTNDDACCFLPRHANHGYA